MNVYDLRRRILFATRTLTTYLRLYISTIIEIKYQLALKHTNIGVINYIDQIIDILSQAIVDFINVCGLIVDSKVEVKQLESLDNALTKLLAAAQKSELNTLSDIDQLDTIILENNPDIDINYLHNLRIAAGYIVDILLSVSINQKQLLVEAESNLLSSMTMIELVTKQLITGLDSTTLEQSSQINLNLLDLLINSQSKSVVSNTDIEVLIKQLINLSTPQNLSQQLPVILNLHNLLNKIMTQFLETKIVIDINKYQELILSNSSSLLTNFSVNIKNFIIYGATDPFELHLGTSIQSQSCNQIIFKDVIKLIVKDQLQINMELTPEFINSIHNIQQTEININQLVTLTQLLVAWLTDYANQYLNNLGDQTLSLLYFIDKDNGG